MQTLCLDPGSDNMHFLNVVEPEYSFHEHINDRASAQDSPASSPHLFSSNSNEAGIMREEKSTFWHVYLASCDTHITSRDPL